MKKYSLFYDHNMPDSNELYCKIPEKKIMTVTIFSMNM